MRRAAQCLEVLHLLERNAKEQCRLNTQLGRDMWDRLMSPLQGATACVGMYPFLVSRHPGQASATRCVRCSVQCGLSGHISRLECCTRRACAHHHVCCLSCPSDTDSWHCPPACSPTSWPSSPWWRCGPGNQTLRRCCLMSRPPACGPAIMLWHQTAAQPLTTPTPWSAAAIERHKCTLSCMPQPT